METISKKIALVNGKMYIVEVTYGGYKTIASDSDFVNYNRYNPKGKLVSRSRGDVTTFVSQR